MSRDVPPPPLAPGLMLSTEMIPVAAPWLPPHNSILGPPPPHPPHYHAVPSLIDVTSEPKPSASRPSGPGAGGGGAGGGGAGGAGLEGRGRRGRGCAADSRQRRYMIEATARPTDDTLKTLTPADQDRRTASWDRRGHPKYGWGTILDIRDPSSVSMSQYRAV